MVSPLNFHGKEQHAGCSVYVEVAADRKGVFLVAESPAVGPGEHCSSHRPTHVEPSSHDLNGTL